MNQAMYEALQEQYQQTNKLLKEILAELVKMNTASEPVAQNTVDETVTDETKPARGRKPKA